MYTVIQENNTAALAVQVEAYLIEGWEMAGGVAIYKGKPSIVHDGTTYCQAMVKYDTESP